LVEIDHLDTVATSNLSEQRRLAHDTRPLQRDHRLVSQAVQNMCGDPPFNELRHTVTITWIETE